MELQLFERDLSGNTILVKYRGSWLIVDNGYLDWSVTVPPMKDPETYPELRWSKWLESMRKDVECVFGILKGRFRILKTGIRLHGVEAADKIWMTCCALHNFLLEEDGLDKEWENGVPSDWEGNLGLHCESDVFRYLPVGENDDNDQNMALRRFDTSGLGVGNDVNRDDSASSDPSDGDGSALEIGASEQRGIRVVCKLSLQFFRSKLVEHFDIIFKQNRIKWPSRNGLATPGEVTTPPSWTE